MGEMATVLATKTSHTLGMRSLNIGRFSKVGGTDLAVTTPALVLYTSAGHVPFLTHSVLKEAGISLDNKILELPLSTIIGSRKGVSRMGLRKFFGLPENCNFITVFNDPVQPLQTGFNKRRSCSVWNESGRVEIGSVDFRDDIIWNFSDPNGGAVQLMCDADTPAGTSHAKRLQKAVTRTTDVLETTMIAVNELRDPSRPKPSLWGSIVGGCGATFVACATEVAKYSNDLDGFVIEGFHSCGDLSDFNFSTCSTYLAKAWSILPEEKPRFFPGALNPAQIYDAVQLGLDLFDSSYVVQISKMGKVLSLGYSYPKKPTDYAVVNAANEDFKENFTPILENCSCYACKNYTKAYLHHLLNTAEMLATTLLMIHNLTVYEECFSRLRL